MFTPQQITEFQTHILSWYEKNKRDLPWRHTREPYAILVSEVMSQQTQISRVVPKYRTWMQRFPTVESLAMASTRDVLQYWSGLGYNRRALYLKKCAEELDGKKWPQTEKELRALPGIGKYTARALLCFAFDKQLAVVDTNVKKVILTKFCQNYPELDEGSTKIASRMLAMTKNMIQEIADELLPIGQAYEWNQALMDYAAAELKKEKIALPKQSKFSNSDRYFRGLTIRILLASHKAAFEQLFEKARRGHALEEDRYIEILLKMEKEGLIQRERGFYFLESEL